MRIREKPDASEFLFIPVTGEEKELMARIAIAVADGQKIKYEGRLEDPENRDYALLNLYIGGREESVTQRLSEYVSSTRTEFAGGIPLLLRGEKEEDKELIWDIRNIYYFGCGGLNFLGQTEIDGQVAYRFTGCRCKLCGAATVYQHCEHKICKLCAEKCTHEWKHGHVHGGGVDVALGTYCKVCGVADEATVRKLQTASLTNLHLEAVANGGVFDDIIELS